jgi:hypothetical protein
LGADLLDFKTFQKKGIFFSTKCGLRLAIIYWDLSLIGISILTLCFLLENFMFFNEYFYRKEEAIVRKLEDDDSPCAHHGDENLNVLMCRAVTRFFVDANRMHGGGVTNSMGVKPEWHC